MDVVTLRNGSQEVPQLVAVTTMILERMLAEEPITLYELLQVLHDPGHRPWGTTGDALVRSGMLARDEAGGYHMHDSTRNILMSAFEGRELAEIKMVNPLAQTKEGGV